jgi:uncharacterized membrane protein YfcA
MLSNLAPWQWAVGALCAFLMGLAKTGLPGVAILVIPLMVLMVGDARHSAAWLLPILCTADLFAVYYWRKHASAKRLFSLLPWVLIGVLLGAAALSLDERVLRPMVGVIVLAMLSLYLWRRWRTPRMDIIPHPVPYGVAAGFATTVANAAGPVMNLYLLSQRLPKEDFIATGAWFFFVINLSKIPVYAYHGLFSHKSLIFNACVVPAVVAGAVSGRRLVDHISQKLFDDLIVVLTALSTLLLFR